MEPMPADAYLRIRTRLAAGRTGLKAGHRTFECPRHVGHLHLGDFASFYGGSRPCETILLGSGIGHHHYFIQLLTVREQFSIDNRTPVYFLFCGFQIR